ncbi:GNAT family N-acetyltransferase [Mucilaginibacter sp. UYCu711]|uniref:GNAT family N-acetyltransferase n=1 Tax=Mucilaginibacter sp. UYCu711 TaxID=3156339 RepID=UPI003D1969DF
MHKVTSTNKATVVDIISRSFDNDEGINYLIPQNRDRQKRLRYLVEYCVEVAMLTGEVFLSDGYKAAALLVNTERKLSFLDTIVLDTKIAFRAIGLGNVIKALKREAKLKSKRPIMNVSYLWFIGVNPDSQGQGIGKSFLGQLALNEREKGRRFILECSPENLNWYQKNGFRIYDELPDAPFQFFMEFVNNENS